MGLALDEPTDAATTYTINEIDLLIEDSVLPYASQNQIDYINSRYGRGFSIAPATGSSCS